MLKLAIEKRGLILIWIRELISFIKQLHKFSVLGCLGRDKMGEERQDYSF